MELLLDMVLGMGLHNLLLEVALGIQFFLWKKTTNLIFVDMDMDTDMVMATSAITKVPKLTGCDDKMDWTYFTTNLLHIYLMQLFGETPAIGLCKQNC